MCDVPADWLRDFSQCLYEWQTLEAGGLAVFAALLGAYFINKQIRQADQHERTRLETKHQAARAVSAIAFSQICRSSQRLITRLGALLNEPRENRIQDQIVHQGLDLDASTMPTLERLLEASTDVAIVAYVSEVIAKIQVTESRLESVNLLNTHEIEYRLIDLAGVYAFAEGIIEYARLETNEVPSEVACERLGAALRLSHVTAHQHPGVHEKLGAQCEQGATYWRLGDDD